MSKYNPKDIESKWRELYEEKKLFQADRDTGRKKFFITVPVIYPNGFLHVGHLYTWTRAVSIEWKACECLCNRKH